MTVATQAQTAPKKILVTASLADTIRAEICRGRYQAGDKLLPERDLATRYKANRSSVREALQILNSEGFIALKGRAGAIVQTADKVSLGAVHHLMFVEGVPNMALLTQFLEVHRTLLLGAIKPAVNKAKDQDIQQLKELLLRLVEITQGNTFVDEERTLELSMTFHTIMGIVTQISNNTVLKIIYGTIHPSVLDDFRKLRQSKPLKILPSMASNLEKIIHHLDQRNGAAIVTISEQLLSNDWLSE